MAPTPCPEYAVGDLVDHIGGLAVAFTGAARRQPVPGADQGGTGDASRLEPGWRDRIAADLAEPGPGLARPGGVRRHRLRRWRRDAGRRGRGGRPQRGGRARLGPGHGTRPALRPRGAGRRRVPVLRPAVLDARGGGRARRRVRPGAAGPGGRGPAHRACSRCWAAAPDSAQSRRLRGQPC
nr:hypothetical protein [Nocardioides convexus]